MTGWHLKIGYSHDYNQDNGVELVAAVALIVGDKTHLAGMADVPQGFVEEYLDPGGCAVTFPESNGLPQVMLLASGGGEFREMKEAVARTIALMAMEAMHSKGINLTVVVA